MEKQQHARGQITRRQKNPISTVKYQSDDLGMKYGVTNVHLVVSLPEDFFLLEEKWKVVTRGGARAK